MKVYKNEITVHRGETFTIDKIVQMPDGSPFIISNRLHNPYLILTVSSSRYTENERYVKNWWLDCSKYPKFKNTRPVRLRIDDWPTTLRDITATMEGAEPNDSVFYIEADGHKEYRYFNKETNTFEPYEFRIVKTFLNSDTKEWVEQSYLYSILLVDCSDPNVTFSDEQEVNTYNLVQTILEPTKLSVLSNIKGALRYGNN